jgi:hypothetical protein
VSHIVTTKQSKIAYGGDNALSCNGKSYSTQSMADTNKAFALAKQKMESNRVKKQQTKG